MLKKVSMLAAAAVLSLGTAASAATIDFTSNGTGAAGDVAGGPLSYTSSAAYTILGVNVGSPTVTVSANGLGVRSTFVDGDPGLIDGKPITTAEILTITFSWAVNLVDFTLGLLDNNDDLEIAFNGGGFTHIGPGLSNPIAGLNNVTSFSIRASGGQGDGLLGNDEFTLASATVSPVPLPAGGLLLLGAMGGLAALRRRKSA